MIYNKDATFPYPILCNSSDSYHYNVFHLDIDLQENAAEYKFNLNYEIGSEFLTDKLGKGEVKLLFIVQSKDNKFFILNKDQKEVIIPKNRISLGKRTTLQMMLRSNMSLTMAENNDLHEFYDDIKDEIIVPAYSVLGYSNTVIFDGSTKKPFEIFEKKLDPNIASDIAIEIGEETILIKYKHENSQFPTYPNNKELNYPYIYMGLQKALYKMIVEHSEDNETLYLDEMDVPTNGLNFKLYNLLKSKAISELTVNNMDEIIYKISDRIIERFVLAIKGINENGN